jgi:hypothetical protein
MKWVRFIAALPARLALMVALALSPQFAVEAFAQGLEFGVDRPGRDYRNFDLPANDPALCQNACFGEAQCKAFTFVRPGIQGPSARCWLKNQVPNPVNNACCVSGVTRAVPPPGDVRIQNPMFAGYPLDICLKWGQGCGKQAADEFCRRQGFARSVSHSVQNDSPPTIIMGDYVLCEQGFCDRFADIVCRRN